MSGDDERPVAAPDDEPAAGSEGSEKPGTNAPRGGRAGRGRARRGRGGAARARDGAEATAPDDGQRDERPPRAGGARKSAPGKARAGKEAIPSQSGRVARGRGGADGATPADAATSAANRADVRPDVSRPSAVAARTVGVEAEEVTDDPRFRFGRPGRPLRREAPFYIGFVGGLGILVAYHLYHAVLNLSGDLVLIAVALFLAVGLEPFVQVLMQSGRSRGASVLIVALGCLVLFVGFGVIIADPLTHQTTALIKELPHALNRLEHNSTVEYLDRKYHVVKRVQDAIANQKTASTLAGGLFGLGEFIINSVYKSFIVLILTLYFLSALPVVSDAAARLVPRSRRTRVVLLGGEVMTRIGGYVSGALVVATVAGLATWLVLGVIGVPYALPLALLVGATDLIPLVGATIGAVVVTGIVLISSVPQALVCAIFFIAYQQLENYFIYPRVMAKTVKVPAALAVVAALLGTALLGIVGALVAVPLAGAVMLIIEEVVIPRQNRL